MYAAEERRQDLLRRTVNALAIVLGFLSGALLVSGRVMWGLAVAAVTVAGVLALPERRQ